MVGNLIDVLKFQNEGNCKYIHGPTCKWGAGSNSTPEKKKSVTLEYTLAQ